MSAAAGLSRAAKLEVLLQAWREGTPGCGRLEETKPAPGPAGSFINPQMHLLEV